MSAHVDVIVMLTVDDTCLKFVNTCVYSASD
jgi:hypothetical protein